MDSTIQLFNKANEVQTFLAGESIFKAGEEGRFMYVVVEGEVDLIIKDTIVETVKAGGIFGEMALIEKENRIATALARTDCKVAPVHEDRFHFLIQQTPFFALKVMRIMAERLRRMNSKLC